jgi:hypothetical protein
MLIADLGSPKEKENAISSAALLPDNTPLEFRVLLSACRVFLGTEEPEKLEGLLQQGPEWERLLALSNRHGVMPLLYRSVSQNCPQAVPAEWLARLRMQYMMNAARNMKMTAELLRILDALKEAGIKAMPLKGPVLAQQLYGDVTLRQFSDLDILVAPEDLVNAVEILANRGYGDEETLKETKRKAYLKTTHHFQLFNPNLRFPVEIHWKFSEDLLGLDFNEKSIMESSDFINILDNRVPSLPKDHLLLLLSLHGIKHLWTKLSWILDISIIISFINKKNNIILWHDLEEEERRALSIGFSLAGKFFFVSIPDGFSYEDINIEAFSNRLATNIISEKDIEADSKEEIVSHWILYSIIFKNPVKRTKLYIRLISTPTNSELVAVHLPDLLFPVYYLIRPIRIFISYRYIILNHIIKKNATE